MNPTEVKEHIFHLTFSDRRHMSSTFLRFQEFYENPEFRGRVFSREEFINWYTGEQGSFTYFDEWEGHNVPSEIFIPFYDGKFDPLTDEEKALLDLFRHKAHPFYVIATFGEGNALDHEIAHGFRTVRPSYRAETDSLLQQFDTSVLESYLAFRKCYHPDIWDDEKQAFLATGLSRLNDFGFDTAPLLEAHAAFRAIFAAHQNHFSEADYLRSL
jgi:hypothetical protein